MKKVSYTLFIIILTNIFSFAQTKNPNYDKALADSLGSDDYGMKSYIFVILKTGTNTSKDEEVRNKAFRGHMNNIVRLAEEGKLIVAGPLNKNDKDYRGLFIFDVKSKEEVKKHLNTDPAISAKYLAYEIFEWYGSAALPVYLDTHTKIEKYRP